MRFFGGGARRSLWATALRSNGDRAPATVRASYPQERLATGARDGPASGGPGTNASDKSRAAQPGWLSIEPLRRIGSATGQVGTERLSSSAGRAQNMLLIRRFSGHKRDDFGRAITLRSYGTKTNGEVRQEVAMRTRFSGAIGAAVAPQKRTPNKISPGVCCLSRASIAGRRVPGDGASPSAGSIRAASSQDAVPIPKPQLRWFP